MIEKYSQSTFTLLYFDIKIDISDFVTILIYMKEIIKGILYAEKKVNFSWGSFYSLS